jgi:sec-independent protein translocase protein TatA
MSLGPAEILVVLVLALIVFGPKRLPEVGRQVGGALRELRKVQDTVQHEIRSVIDDTMSPTPRAVPPPSEIESATDAGIEAPATGSEPSTHDTDGHDIDGLSGGTFS